MRKQKKRNMMGISLLAVMGITLLTSGAGMNEVKAAQTATSVAIDANTFPDSVFRQWVGNNCDANHDGLLSDDERLQCTKIRVNNAGIASLEGIGLFPNLSELDCEENSLSSLDVSKNKALTKLYCSKNNLSTLNVSANTNLIQLVCDDNNISSLDVSKNTALEMLYCSHNNLSSLNVSKNSALEMFDCSYNNISSLDVSHNPHLGHFVCNDNNISSLNVSKNTEMHRLHCANNNLTSLDVSKNTDLSDLDCEGNSLNSLDLSKNTKLILLNCSYNSLSSLDLSKNTKLSSFHGFKGVQNVWVPMYKNGNEYYIDLSGLPLGDRGRVSMTEYWMETNGAAYDSTANRINLSETKDVGYTVWYDYETNGPASIGNTKMPVGLRISEVRDITKPTTEEPTTEEPTTEETTTEEPTTEETTTEESTTEEVTTEESTTEEVTTEEPTTEKPTAKEPTIEGPTTTAPATTQTDNGKEPAPNTGDTTPLYLVISLLLVSFVGGMTLYIRRKKKL